MRQIKFSIITVTRNSEKYLVDTILSVVNQTYSNVEYIIIDGGSTDATKDILHKYKEHFSHYISEPDEGIAHAMNKGIDLATGNYVLFLNSDDYLIDDNILNHISIQMKNMLDIYIFKVNFLYENDRHKISLNRNLGPYTNIKMGSCHQGQFVTRDLLIKLNKFDTNLKINFDYDFLLRAYREKITSKSIDTIISVMRQHGISSRRDWRGIKERFDEERIIHFKNCKNKLWYFIYKIYWALYIPYRYIISRCIVIK
jgi:glycosyltransferase involved in cell wall biosynthesis